MATTISTPLSTKTAMLISGVLPVTVHLLQIGSVQVTLSKCGEWQTYLVCMNCYHQKQLPCIGQNVSFCINENNFYRD